MAKAKSSARDAVKLPSGFKAIERIGSFWKGEKHGDSIEGKLLKITTKTFPKNGKIPARDAQVYHLETPSGVREVTESGGLGALTQVKKGQTVYIAFVGMKKLKGRSPMREYIVGVK